jgi:hypothetical protein
VNVQHLDVFGGENRTLTLYARDASNLPVDLTGSTISWTVGRRPNDPTNRTGVFTKTGTIVSASDGSFTVPVVPSDTCDLFPGNYQHVAEVTDSDGNVSVVCLGRFRVRQVTQDAA